MMRGHLAQLRRVPWWVWVGLVVAAGLGFLAWHNYVSDQADEDWHDPHQPDVQVDVRASQVPQPSQIRWPKKTYPGSLAAWSQCWVGDC